ncbi:HD domain-containing phosphohydrolase [uncultured Sphaerochaeta sp.]|uniref:bifunctional diguanylate cyclase/phosphohydrolase n=1 Tax=uncultured Sphaerochaeta sp. TaxID=886478 RepID=UPI002AA6FFD6|nr:HD domain-containing phosphohydrolase [uncultured Sphaerochaeta sp.]
MMVNVLFNIAMLLTLSVFFTTYPFKNPRKLYSYHILVGIVIGVVGILVMLNPFILEEGVVFDSRSILIVVSGMVFGLTPTLIGSGMIAVFRILKGGAGLYAGLATIITSTMVGVLWHHYRYQIVLERRRHINIEFYLVGFLDHAIMLLCMLLMPSSVRIHVFSVMTFPILVFYPVGTYLLCLLLFSQAYRLADIAALKKSEQQFKTIFEKAPIGMSLTNLRTGEIQRINQSYLDILGYTREEMLGHTWAEFSHPEDVEMSNQITQKMFSGEEDSFAFDKRFLKKDGSTIWANLSLCVFSEDALVDRSSLCMTVDITKRKLAEKRILYASTHDALTDLYDRMEFERIISNMSLEGNLPLSVVFADMNRLRIINEAFGREQGNRILKQVATLLRETFPDCSTLFRVGGDEFALLLPGYTAKECEPCLEEVAERVSTFRVMDAVAPSISFGLYVVEDASFDLNEAVKLAEKHLATQKLLDSPQMQGKAVYAIINTLHEKNKREEAHSRRVSELSEQLGRSFGLSERSCNELRLVGLLHDIGKIAIAENILNKDGKLSPLEWEEMKRHAEIGFRILSSVEDMQALAPYVLAHHEHFDGTGYPKALHGESIPLQSRMIAIADAFDAMTSERTYRKAVSAGEAAKEIKRCAGTQLDPLLAKLFIEQVLALSYDQL